MKRILLYPLCILIIATGFCGVCFPTRILNCLKIPEGASFFALLLSCCLAGGGAALCIVWHLGRREWYLVRRFSTLPFARRATVTTEFMLVIPIIGVMFCTLFSMAEIAHAQLVFRYASFSALRAGAVIKKYDRKSSGFTAEFMIPKQDQQRMRMAAAVALAGLDHPTPTNSPKPPAIDKFSIDDVAKLFHDATPSRTRATPTTSATTSENYWAGKHAPDYFNERLKAALAALPEADFKVTVVSPSPTLNPPNVEELVNLFKNLIQAALKKILDGKSGGGILSKILDFVLKLIGGVLEKIIGGLCELLGKILQILGANTIIQHFFYPINPAVLELQMAYQPPLVTASIFKIITGDKPLKLHRTGGYNIPSFTYGNAKTDGSTPQIAFAYGSGGRSETSVGLIKMLSGNTLNFLPGDCGANFGTGGGDMPPPPPSDPAMKALMDQVTKAEKEVQKITDKLDKINAEISNYETQISNLEKQIEQRKKAGEDTDDLEKELESLKRKLKDAQKRKTETEKELKDKQKEINDLSKQIEDLGKKKEKEKK